MYCDICRGWSSVPGFGYSTMLPGGEFSERVWACSLLCGAVAQLRLEVQRLNAELGALRNNDKREAV